MSASKLRPWLAPLAVFLAAAAWFLWNAHDWYDPVNDAAIYIETARSLARGEGYSYLGEPFRVRPPGFSALLAPLVAAPGLDPHALNVFTSLCAALCIALFFAWARTRTGTAVALGLAALVALNPLIARFASQSLSDLLGAGLVLACLLVERWSRARPSPARECVLGLAIGLSAYVRTLSILLVPAVLAARVLERLSKRERGGGARWVLRELLPLTAVALLVLLPWSARNHAAGERPAVDQTMLFSYSTGMWHVDPGDPGSARLSLSAVLARIPERASQMLSLTGTNLSTLDGGRWAFALGGLVLALALWTAVRRREPADFLLAGTVVLLSIYFAFRDRLFLPAWLLALPNAAVALLAVAERWTSPRTARSVFAGLLAAGAIVAAHPRRDWPEIERAHRQYDALARGVAAVVPDGKRLASMRGWHYQVFLDRPVYNLGFAYQRAHGIGGIEDVLAQRAIDAIVIAHWDPAAAPVLDWLEQRFPRTEIDGDGLVFWVTPR